MLRYQKFTIGHFWCSEFGCTETAGAIDYLLKYSPLHTIKPQKYPAMLITTADHDDRVVPLHSFKYTAELQHTAGDGSVAGQRPLLIRVEIDAGHGGGKPTEKRIAEEVELYAFMARVIGIKWTE